jgi:hypothetical protein
VSPPSCGSLFGTTAADADGSRRNRSRGHLHAEFGQDWYAFGDDNENWDFAVQCVVGLRGAGTSEFHARTVGKTIVSMPANAKKGVIYGQVPVEAWLYRTLTLGERPAEGCGYNDYDQIAAKKDCDAETRSGGCMATHPPT